ncbi:MAG TPA: methyl-accepting chemotaxis protein [Anaeromyxobacter sp.]|nr:methyl-accepting chemotaxis protein [Anaeromyxobacter sp.]
MRRLVALAFEVALAQAIVLAPALLAASGGGLLDAAQLRAWAVGLAATWILECLAIVAAGAALGRPIVSALQAGAREPGAVSAGTRAALELPTRGATVLLVTALVGTGGAIAVAQARGYLPSDVALSLLAVGVAAAFLGAMAAHLLCAVAVARLVEDLGSPEVVPGASVRSKVATLGLAVALVSALPLGAAAYLRSRLAAADTLEASAGQLLDLAALDRSARSPGELAQALGQAAGAPAAVIAPTGRVLHQVGEPFWPEEGPAPTPGATRTARGWVVVREVRPAGFAALLVSEEVVRERLRPLARVLLAVGLTALAGAGAVAWFMASALALPFQALGSAAERMAAGDVTASAPTVSRDEMGVLADRFRRIGRLVGELVSEVRETCNGVSAGLVEADAIGARVRDGSSAEQAGVAALQQAVGAMEGSMALVSRGLGGLSDYVSATTRTVSEMAEAFDEVRRKAGELERAMGTALGDVEHLGTAGRDAEARLTDLENLAGRSGGTLAEVRASVAVLERAAGESEATAATVAEMAERAGQVVEGTVHGIDDLRRAVADAHQRIAVLGRRSDDIDQVVDFISEVAGRTNLLSLNASIIASQAGEHGKAFAVVADQIRDLAAQIARSTKSIGDIIRAVREDVQGTASLIERGDALAAEGVQLARNSLEALGQIRRSTARGRETAAGIRAAVQTHALSSREVAALVEHVAEGSRAVAAAVQLVGRNVGGAHSISRGVTGMADRVARTLEEQAGLGRRQLENLSRVERMIKEINQAVESHAAATRNVRAALASLGDVAAAHDAALSGLTGVADQIGARARVLSERVGRFRV